MRLKRLLLVGLISIIIILASFFAFDHFGKAKPPVIEDTVKQASENISLEVYLNNSEADYTDVIPSNLTGSLDKNNSVEALNPLADDAGITQDSINNIMNANNKFVFAFYSNVRVKDEGNIFYSPYSISTAIAMIYEGARGQTAEEIRSVFYFPENSAERRAAIASVYNKLNKKDIKYKLQTANALWIQKDYQLLNDYVNTVERYYAGQASNLDFVGESEEARQIINGWIENKTNNKIREPLSPGFLNPSTRFVLTNAIYFKGKWTEQFDKRATSEEDFRINATRIVKIPMMYAGSDREFNYAETENLQILEMQYEGEELSMLVILPKNDDLKSLEKSFTLGNFNEWKNQLRKQEVRVSMPKFTFTTKYTLNDNLKEMGMPSAFSEGSADFSGMDGSKNLFIQFVIHQAFVDVNEEGTEAAAATIGGGGLTSVSPVIVFRADHPFIFIIQERETGNILFIGRVVDPTK